VGDESEYAADLREKAERITAVADHLRRRKARLARVRELRRQKRTTPSSLERMTTEQVAKMERERRTLEEARRAVELKERKLVRRWARSKAVTVLGAFMIMLLVSAGASWLIADWMFPAQVSAATILEAKGPDHKPVAADKADAWRNWQTELLKNHAFHQTLAKKMAERRLDAYSDPAVLSQHLKSNLTVDLDRDGVMVLTLAGFDSDEITSFLDLMTGTIVSESNRTYTKKSDPIRTVATGERREGGRTRYATVNPVPIKDDRMHYALPIFGAMLVVCIVMIVVGYTQLLKAKRVFEDADDGPLFEQTKIGD
jgi:hypothetical protein